MDANQQVVRDLYAARERRDWDAVRAVLAEEVVWREGNGDQDYSGDHHGRETVARLLEKLLATTGGTFTLEPEATISTADYAAASVRWQAERRGTRADGNELAVFRIAGGQIAEAWFFADQNDPRALREVFSFATGR